MSGGNTVQRIPEAESMLRMEIHRLITENLVLFKLFEGTTVAITGATGFIGTYLVKLLLTAANEFRIDVNLLLIVRDEHLARLKYGSYFVADRVSFIEQDVIESIDLPDSIDYVIHCASKANPEAYMFDPVGTTATNVIGTYNLLQSLVGSDVTKVVYLSTVEVYGEHDETGEVSEEVVGKIDPTRIRNSYPLSKSCAENLSLSFNEQFKIPVCIARLAYIYGPGDNIDDPKIVTSFLKSIRDGKDIVLKSAGSQLRTYCYISDAVLGILSVLLKGSAGGVYNISSELDRITIRNIAETIVELFAEGTQRVRFEEPSDTEKNKFSPMQNNILSNIRARSLGFKESMNMVQGLWNTGIYFGMTPTKTTRYKKRNNHQTNQNEC